MNYRRKYKSSNIKGFVVNKSAMMEQIDTWVANFLVDMSTRYSIDLLDHPYLQKLYGELIRATVYRYLSSRSNYMDQDNYISEFKAELAGIMGYLGITELKINNFFHTLPGEVDELYRLLSKSIRINEPCSGYEMWEIRYSSNETLYVENTGDYRIMLFHEGDKSEELSTGEILAEEGWINGTECLDGGLAIRIDLFDHER